MPKNLVLSSKKMKVEAAKAEMSLREVNDAAGFGPNYIYRLGDSEGILLTTVNRIANALGCNPLDLLDVTEEAKETEEDQRWHELFADPRSDTVLEKMAAEALATPEEELVEGW